MLGAIYIGLSGMNAFSRGLTTISHNVTNLNSPGYKSSSVRFTDVFALGGLGAAYAGRNGDTRGVGVRYGQTSVDFSQGDTRQTGGDLDLAMQGDGFIVLSEGERTFYARTGQFAIDEAGFIALLGSNYRLNVLNAQGRTQTVNVDERRTHAPQATTRIAFSDNVSSTASEALVSDIAVYDSRGTRHVWQVSLTPTGAASPGEWTVAVTDQTSGAVGSGVLRFIGGVVDPSSSTLVLNTTPEGADPLSVTLDFSSGVTSFSSGTTSTLRAASVDGNGMGTLSRVTVNSAGHVELIYSNGKTEDMGAVALADFRDTQRLERVGDGLFRNRGAEQRLFASGTDGMGSLVSGWLEASNVNLAEQFGDLILIQRGFQASSQVVSVSNGMIQQLFGIRGQG